MAETNMQLGTLSAPLDSLMSALLKTYFINQTKLSTEIIR